MAWLIFFFSQSDAFHMSQGPEFCTLQTLLVYHEFFLFSLMASICPRDPNSAPYNHCWYTRNFFPV